MNRVLTIMLMVCVLGAVGGCHSGTIRGVGSDVEKLGERMQR